MTESLNAIFIGFSQIKNKILNILLHNLVKMETAKKFVELLKIYIAKTKELEPQIKWADHKELIRNFQREIDEIEQQIKGGELRYKYAHFQYEVLHGKSPNRDVYEYLGMDYPELKRIQSQIDDLIDPIIDSNVV